jgi:hypothetical protein
LTVVWEDVRERGREAYLHNSSSVASDLSKVRKPDPLCLRGESVLVQLEEVVILFTPFFIS